jgi:hypothetical protein
MPQFEVMRKGKWFEAECRELGVLITARTQADVEATARQTAAAEKKEAVFTFRRPPPLIDRLLQRFLGPFVRDNGLRGSVRFRGEPRSSRR